MPGRYHGDDISPAYQKMTDSFRNSKKVLLIISSHNSQYPGICAEHAKKGSKLSVILSKQVFERYLPQFKKELDTLLLFDNSDLYVLDNSIVPPTIAVTDTMVLTCYSSGKSIPDKNSSIVSFGEDAVQWGLELFEYFKVFAKPLSLNLQIQ
jgi:predicted transcriptional regulator